jgi:hypothetical protein
VSLLPAVSEEIVEFRIGVQVFLQPKDPLMLYGVPYLAVRIKQVAELPRSHGAGFDTCRVTSVSSTLDAERALLDHALVAWTITEIVRLGIDLLGFAAGFRPIEVAGAIRTGGHAIPAADAPVVIDDYDSIRLFPCGLGGTGPHARRVLALLTLDRHVEIFFFRHLRGIVVFFRILEVYPFLALFKPEDRNPMNLRVFGLVVLINAGVNAGPAADAPG